MTPNTAKKYRRHRESVLVYGGDHLKTRLGRSTPRPLSMGRTMHFVLKSTKATGPWSFRTKKALIEAILEKFAQKHGVDLLNTAVQGNHLHLNLQVSAVRGYKRFIRAVTAAIAMAVTGASRWNPLGIRFWDRRPFSRIVLTPSDEITVQNYVELNKLEASGLSRTEARRLLSQKVAEESRRKIRILRCHTR